MVYPPHWGIWAICSVVVATIGPFGGYGTVPFPVRMAFWAVLLAAAFCVATGILTVLDTVARHRPRWQTLAFGVAAFTSIHTPITLALVQITPEGLRGRMVSPLFVVSVTFLVTSAVTAIRSLVLNMHGQRARKPPVARPGAPAPEASPTPRLRRRIAPDAGPILRLEADGHYVIVHARHDRQRLRMRLTDAIAEMEPVEGHACHRSHWVTSAAVVGTARQNGRPVLVLSDGARVPVTRTYEPGLRAAGLLT